MRDEMGRRRDDAPEHRKAIRTPMPHLEQPATMPTAALALQRAAGNQLVTRLVTGASTTAQREKKSEEQRGATHRRRAIARPEIERLAREVKQPESDHFYRGVPLDKPLDLDDAQGLHGYVDRKLPDGVERVKLHGNPNAVHTIDWRWKTPKTANGPHPPLAPEQRVAKPSTMLPRWIPKEHGLALLALAQGAKSAHSATVHSHILDTFSPTPGKLNIRFTRRGGSYFPEV